MASGPSDLTLSCIWIEDPSYAPTGPPPSMPGQAQYQPMASGPYPQMGVGPPGAYPPGQVNYSSQNPK